MDEVLENVLNKLETKIKQLDDIMRGEGQTRMKFDDDDEPEMIQNRWVPADGVTPKMLYEICQILHISHYAFDATNKCFLKYVSENNHSYPALVYYAVNDHMYHIKDINAVKKLVSKTLKTEYKIKSSKSLHLAL